MRQLGVFHRTEIPFVETPATEPAISVPGNGAYRSILLTSRGLIQGPCLLNSGPDFNEFWPICVENPFTIRGVALFLDGRAILLGLIVPGRDLERHDLCKIISGPDNCSGRLTYDYLANKPELFSRLI